MSDRTQSAIFIIKGAARSGRSRRDGVAPPTPPAHKRHSAVAAGQADGLAAHGGSGGAKRRIKDTPVTAPLKHIEGIIVGRKERNADSKTVRVNVVTDLYYDLRDNGSTNSGSQSRKFKVHRSSCRFISGFAVQDACQSKKRG
jgi:hypothetical protein